MITIQKKSFNKQDIKKLYPAGIIKTGFGDETTQISLEWIESEADESIEVVNYAIFLTTKDGQNYSFYYPTKDELFEELDNLSKSL